MARAPHRVRHVPAGDHVTKSMEHDGRTIYAGVDHGAAMGDQAHELDLISGRTRAISRDELGLRQKVTEDFKKVLGECDGVCEWHPTYGWVPEAGCPVHDPDG